MKQLYYEINFYNKHAGRAQAQMKKGFGVNQNPLNVPSLFPSAGLTASGPPLETEIMLNTKKNK